jgi:hypothetical protein
MPFKMIEDWWGKSWKLKLPSFSAQVVEDPHGKGFYWNVEEDGEIIVSGCESSPFEAMGYCKATIETFSGGKISA